MLRRATFSIALGVAVSSLFFAAGSSADDSLPPELRNGFATYQETYNAYRQARLQNDWKKLFLLMTPSLQDAELCIAYNYFCARQDDQAQQALTKFGLDDKSVNREYAKQYLKKHGNTPSPLFTQEEANNASQATDNDLLISSILQLAQDRTGLYVKANALLRAQDLTTPIHGDLKHVRVAGNTAIGQITLSGIQSGVIDLNTGRRSKETLASEYQVQFTKLNGRWFFEGLTPFSPPIAGPAPAFSR